VLVEEKREGADEIFVSVTYDGRTRRASLLASKAGGIEVESNGKVTQREISVLTVNGASDYSAWEVAAALGYSGQTLLRLSVVIIALIARFIEWDALLLEVNPLILDANGEWCVADVHLELDDDAAFRQQAMLARLPFSSHDRTICIRN
jgi:succinyl-CoA synthetase beta subunit